MGRIETLGRMAALLDRSTVATLLILLILIARMLLKGETPKHTFPILWLIVLVRLLCPFSLDVPFSVFSVFGRTRTELVNAVADRINQEASSLYMAVALKRLGVPGVRVVPVAPVRVIWLIGFAACAAFFLMTHLYARKRYAGLPEAADERIEQFLRTHPLRRTVCVRSCDSLHAPLTYGIVRPVVVLPAALLRAGDDALVYALAQAWQHVRRMDALVRLLTVLALCQHWFNPLCWVMLVVLNRDLELLCDALMLRAYGEKARTEYPRMLLSMEEKHGRMTPLCNGYSRGALEERVTVMMMRPYAGRGGKVAAGVLTLLALTVLTQSTPQRIHDFVRIIEPPVDVTGENRRAEDVLWIVGQDVQEGFYVVTGEEEAGVEIQTASGSVEYAMEDVHARVGERKFVLYLAEGMHVRFTGASVLTPITRGKVISDKTATVYIGSGMFRAGASIPVGVYRLSAAPGLGEGMCLVYDVEADGKTTREVGRIALTETESQTVRLTEGQILEIRSGVLECNG